LLLVYFTRNLIFAFILIISIGLTLINFSGCQSHEKVIKIGNQAALSGDDKFFGDDQLISLSLAVSELSPVRVGGFDYKINLVSKDDGGNSEKAFLVAQELVEENVSAVIGSTFNGTTKASIPVYAEYNIPIISPSAQGLELSRGFSNFFRVIMNNQQKIENIANFLKDNFSPKKLILIDNGEDYSVKLIDSLIEVFDEFKINYLKRYSVKADPEQDKILAENLLIDEPDLIFVCTEYNQLANLITAVRKVGLQTQFITEELGMNDGISLLADKQNLEGLIAILPEPPALAKYTEDKKAIEFWRKYTDFAAKMKNNSISKDGPGPYAPYSYDSFYLIIEAMKRANSIMPEDYLEELKKSSYDGVVGHIEFNSNGDRINPLSTAFMIKNGDWVRY
jgi:branched-chain amino acid transport system substrate-binding protein